MIKYIKYSIGIFIILATARFVPHPPNFTSLIALSFYVPIIFGLNFIPALIVCFMITDLFIGFHSTVLFTWGSVVLIGLMSLYFNKSLNYRLCGALLGAAIFFVVSNFGVWLNGSYGYSIDGLINCYFLAIPFFAITTLSTIIYSFIIESLMFFFKFRVKAN